MNNFVDFSVLEFVFRIKDVYKDVYIIIFLMGFVECESKIKEFIEVGCDSCVFLSDKRFVGFDVYFIVYVLVKVIEKFGNFDLILCGEFFLDGEIFIVLF